MQPRVPLALAIALLGVLVWIADARPSDIVLADAAQHEGHWVRVAGQARDVRLDADGARFTMVAGGASLAIQASQPPMPGGWVEATGRLARSAGRLTLFADDVRALPVEADTRTSWADVAQDPSSWTNRLAALDGWVDGHEFEDRDGHAVRLGAGPWPRAGPVTALGTLRFDGACLCHRFDAAEVRVWTP